MHNAVKTNRYIAIVQIFVYIFFTCKDQNACAAGRSKAVVILVNEFYSPSPVTVFVLFGHLVDGCNCSVCLHVVFFLNSIAY